MPRDDDAPSRGYRVHLNLQTIMLVSDDIEVPVTVLDISRDNFRIRTHEQLFIDEQVELKLGESGFAKGVICWIEGSEAGGRFALAS